MEGGRLFQRVGEVVGKIVLKLSNSSINFCWRERDLSVVGVDMVIERLVRR